MKHEPRVHAPSKPTQHPQCGLYRTLCGLEVGRVLGVRKGPKVANAHAGEVTCGTCRKAMIAALRREL